MNLLAQSAFLKALGWALLHSLWQMGVLWLLYTLLTGDGKRFQSRQRYNLALILVSIGTLGFVYTLIQEFYQFTEPAIVYHQVNSFFTTDTTLLSQVASMLDPALPVLSILYLLAIALLFTRFFRQYYFSRQLINSGLQKVDPELRLFLEQMAQRFVITKKIRIGLSELINTPLTVGFWKPVILLPVAAINHLSIKQTEAIILHELNHIKQNDYLVNLLIACLDILLFFNPFSRLLTGILMKERENSCDDLVLQFRYPASDYAHALLVLEQYRLEATPLLAISATGNSKKLLLNRVQRILHGKNNETSANYRMIAFLLSAFLIAFTGWYNPGKVIHQQLPDAFANRKATPLPSKENVPIFYTTLQNEPATIKPSTVVYTVSLLKTNEDEKDTPESFFEEDSEDNTAEVTQLTGVTLSDAVTTTTPASSVVGFATTVEQPREFSIQESLNPAPVANEGYFYELQPYLPSSSFSYRYTEDTIFPKKNIPTPGELKAKEDLEKSLKALEEIDWEKLQKVLGDKNFTIDQLQLELKKALAEVDWSKIDEEYKSNVKQEEQEVRIRNAYIERLNRYQKERVQQQQNSQQRKQAIVVDRLMQNAELRKCEDGRKKGETVKKVKKIVVI